MKLPDLPYKLGQKQSEIVAIRGINYSDNYKDGALAESENISVRCFPYFTTRKPREKKEQFKDALSLMAWEHLFYTKNDENGEISIYHEDLPDAPIASISGVMDKADKQIAVINTKLVIWPDKKYVDISKDENGNYVDLSVHDLESTFSLVESVSAFNGTDNTGVETVSCKATFSTDRIEISPPYDSWTMKVFKFSDFFKVGDVVRVVGCVDEKRNNKVAVIKEIDDETQSLIFEEGTFYPASEYYDQQRGASSPRIYILREVPDLDFICESENRLWGVSNKTKTIYASALGDPTNFNVFRGLSTDSYAAAVGSEGDFTGICKLSSSILVFKERYLHKILGSYPAEYCMYTYKVEGLLNGCHKSMQVIDDVLYYMTPHGIYTYSGGETSLLSYVFGSKRYIKGVGGSDGENYYLSALDEDGEWDFLVYNINTGIWLREDNTHVIDFARRGHEFFYLDDKHEVYKVNSDDAGEKVEWYMLFNPFFEALTNKKYFKILMRAEVEKGGYLKAQVRFDDGPFKDAGTVIGGDDGIVSMMIPINRADNMQLKLSGKGEFKLKGLQRIFRLGSDRR